MIPRVNNTKLSDQEFDAVIADFPQSTRLSDVVIFANENESFETPPRVVPLDEFSLEVIFAHKADLWFVCGVT